jgi:hypothetical protein
MGHLLKPIKLIVRLLPTGSIAYFAMDREVSLLKLVRGSDI